MSGLLFVSLAVLWAVVLIPKALRHHDELARTRPVDEVSSAMRVLARNQPAGSRRAQPGGNPVPQIPGPRRPVDAAPYRKAAARAARRRRRILALLVLLDLGTAAAVAVGGLAVWAPAVPVAATVGFLLVARVAVRRDRARRARAAQGRRTAPAADVPVAEPVPTPPVLQERNEQGLAVVSGLEDTASFPLDLLGTDATRAERSDLWDPVPMTLPTYVSKPRAHRSVRTIDLTAAGVTTSGRDATASALVAEAAVAALDDTADQGAARRAAGG